MAIFDNLGRALRWLREERQARQYQVAANAGITKAMLSAYETGKQRPSLDTLEKILLALGCDLAELHDALAVIDGGTRHARPRPGRQPAPPTSPPAVARRPPVDIYRVLGLGTRLPRGEEEALEELLEGFHKLVRHLHRTAQEPLTSNQADPEGQTRGDAGNRVRRS